jgi:hypothetical protein
VLRRIPCALLRSRGVRKLVDVDLLLELWQLGSCAAQRVILHVCQLYHLVRVQLFGLKFLPQRLSSDLAAPNSRLLPSRTRSGLTDEPPDLCWVRVQRPMAVRNTPRLLSTPPRPPVALMTTGSLPREVIFLGHRF